jgi:hypothetical protein
MPIDPMLGTLQDNGGLTQTMALLPGFQLRHRQLLAVDGCYLAQGLPG